MPDTELVFGTDGEAVRWPDGELMERKDFDEPGKKRKDHMGCWIKRVVWVGDQVDVIDFGVNLDRF